MEWASRGPVVCKDLCVLLAIYQGFKNISRVSKSKGPSAETIKLAGLRETTRNFETQLWDYITSEA